MESPTLTSRLILTPELNGVTFARRSTKSVIKLLAVHAGLLDQPKLFQTGCASLQTALTHKTYPPKISSHVVTHAAWDATAVTSGLRGTIST